MGDIVNSLGDWELDVVDEWLTSYVRHTINGIPHLVIWAGGCCGLEGFS